MATADENLFDPTQAQMLVNKVMFESFCHVSLVYQFPSPGTSDGR